jgi:hypothetical protein
LLDRDYFQKSSIKPIKFLGEERIGSITKVYGEFHQQKDEQRQNIFGSKKREFNGFFNVI